MTSENLGARKVEEVEKDITSLTNADNEPLSTWSDETDIDVIDSATVVSHDNKSYLAKVDQSNSQVLVVSVSDGTNAGSSTDVGKIKIRFEGRR